MNIELKKLTLINFKGARDVTVNFSKNTDILGKNESGKTTFVDSFNFLLFGKDSSGNTKFDIKTFDAFNKIIPNLDHEVRGELEIDGNKISLNRAYVEEYEKEDKTKLKGHHFDYFINEVPVSAGDYTKYVESLIREDVFRLLTDPFYFNLKIDIPNRRKMLMSMAGMPSDIEIAGQNAAFVELLHEIEGKKTIEMLKSETAEKIKNIKERLSEIDIRLKENKRGKPEPVDIAEIDRKIVEKQSKIDEIDETINSSLKKFEAENNKILENLAKVNELNLQLQTIEFEAKEKRRKEVEEINSERNAAIYKVNELKSNKVELERTKILINESIAKLETENEEARKDYAKEQKKEFSSAEKLTCPLYGNECSDLTAIERFEKNKQESEQKFFQLKKITCEEIIKFGKANNEIIEENNKKIARVVKEICVIDGEIEELEKISNLPEAAETPLSEILLKNKEYQKILSEIELLKSEVEVKAPNNEELKSKKTALQNEIYALKELLSVNKKIEEIANREDELLKEEKTLSGELSMLHKTEDTISAFNHAKMEYLETKVNSMFSICKFNLFEKLINGNEVEICEATANGIPFRTQNNAMRINMGLDIIKTFSDFYGVKAPIFIDNAESVNELFETNSQMIRLIVTNTPLTVINN